MAFVLGGFGLPEEGSVVSAGFGFGGIGPDPEPDEDYGGGIRLPRYLAKPRTVRRTEHRTATLAARYRLTQTTQLTYTRRQADEDTLVLLGVL